MSGLNEQLGIENQLLDTGNQGILSIGRPTFLTVLCILAFIGNGLGFFQGIMAYVMSGVYSNMFRMMSRVQNSAIRRDFDQVYDIIAMMGWWGIMMIAGSLICITGAIFMWKQKKAGFYTYLIGQLLPIITMLLFFSSTVPGEMIGAVIFIGILSSIFPVAFIIMFATNLKYLNK